MKALRAFLMIDLDVASVATSFERTNISDSVNATSDRTTGSVSLIR